MISRDEGAGDDSAAVLFVALPPQHDPDELVGRIFHLSAGGAPFVQQFKFSVEGATESSLIVVPQMFHLSPEPDRFRAAIQPIIDAVEQEYQGAWIVENCRMMLGHRGKKFRPSKEGYSEIQERGRAGLCFVVGPPNSAEHRAAVERLAQQEGLPPETVYCRIQKETLDLFFTRDGGKRSDGEELLSEVLRRSVRIRKAYITESWGGGVHWPMILIGPGDVVPEPPDGTVIDLSDPELVRTLGDALVLVLDVEWVRSVRAPPAAGSS